MKSKTLVKAPRPGTLEFAYLAVPLIALTPNFFIVPDLSFQGLATQEAVYGVLITLFALAGVLWSARSRDTSIRLSRELAAIFLAFAAFLSWQLISLSWAPAPYDGARLSGIWLGFGVLFGVGALAVRPLSAVRLYYLLTLTAALLAISVIYERWVYGEYLKGIFFSHGISAEILATLLPLQLLIYLCHEKRWLAAVAFLVSGLSVIALLIGLRRGALLGTLVAIIGVGAALMMRKVRLQSWRRLALIGAMFLTLSTILGVVFHERILFRIQGATQMDAAEGGLRTRLRGWITAWEMGKRHPIIGVGAGGYPNLYGPYRKYFASDPKYAAIARTAGGEDFDEIRTPLAHNEFLEIFVELGIVGLSLLLVLLYLLLKPLWRSRGNYWVLGVLLGLISFAISSSFSAFSLRYTPAALIVACLLSIGYAFGHQATDLTDAAEGPQSQLTAPLKFPKWAVLIPCLFVAAGCSLFAWRAYRVYESQWLQGRASPRTPSLDFVYFPDNAAGNQALERRYHSVLALDPENSGARLGLGLLLFQMKKPAEAISSIQYALDHGYSRPFGYALLAFAQEQKGELECAAKTMAECVASFPQSIFARAVYGEMLRKSGRIDEFRANQTAMYEINKPLANSWEVALKMGVDEAMAEAKRQGLISPDHLEPRFAASLVGVRAFHYLKKVEN